MILFRAALLAVLLVAAVDVAPAHATGAAAAATVDNRARPRHAVGGPWAALEGALARHAPLWHATEIMALFEEWGATFGREYATWKEKSERLVVWLENHVLIETHNAKPSSFALAHNEFSDLTHAEFRERMRLGEFSPALARRNSRASHFREFHEEETVGTNSRLRGPGEGGAAARRLAAAEDGRDWHAAGFMGPVRNQGLCGACWAFSAAGAIEAAMAIEKFNGMSPDERTKLAAGPAGDGGLTSDLDLVVPLSEQDMIDCDTLNEEGCDGGLMTDAFEEEEVKVGICSEADYPYVQAQGSCASDLCAPVPGSIVRDHADVVPRRNEALRQALDVQPVTAALVATDPTFQFYSRGIYSVEGCGRVTKELDDDDCEMVYEGQDVCFPDVDHGVLVVGYGRDETVAADVQTFFKVKNSWGGAWGEDGYFRIARYETDKTDPLDNWGECAVLSLLSSPIME